MNGGYIHDRSLQAPLAQAFEQVGAIVRYQVHSRSCGHTGYSDFTALFPGGQLIAVEIEMTTRRIENDIRKANELEAHELWIIVPNRRVLQASQRRLRQLQALPHLPVFVLTLPLALQRVSDCFPLPLVGRGKQEIKKQSPD
ncbi:hypothetical protein [Bythopirellula polymerisocia]|uniref:Uncharacterized protein n=1 Tax=Bythopirellula polymerisocia TaxID=2528003 RepID=A0A5C6C960_9BACT|nr:hypothetical protein [Bythopirellula polymerisocia]TWU20722.1 hypothetical protein Pla144_48890 [Bythopirellula polymerisocia]